MFVLLGLVTSLTLCPQSAAQSASRPNVLMIMADDMGFSDLGCFGGEVETPHLDRLAKGGMRFTQFYSNAKCSPTRASLLSGLYCQQVKVTGGPAVMQDCVTLAEVLGAGGYRTWMTGKWHAAELPTQRGFERYFGLADGCCNFWNPGKRREGEPEPGRKRAVRRWAIDGKEYKPYTPEDKDFYTTDAFTDYALEYMEGGRDDERPFFLYVAYTAPHYPLHAWPQDIERCMERYGVGWDAIRKARFAQQQAMGLTAESWALSARDPGVPSWDSIEDESMRAEWVLKMATYAAMIERMDQNIGRLLKKLSDLGEEQNTLVLFFTDNGGCAERVHKTPDIPPGGLASYRTVDPPWANASNTPFRKYKSWLHEGGIASPLIAYWPQRIAAGGLTRSVGHLIDMMPTLVEACGVQYPENYGELAVPPMEGVSLIPVLTGEDAPRTQPVFWSYGAHRAVRDGRWKLVGRKQWELYDISADRCELHDLAAEEPAVVARLAAAYEAWAVRVK